MKNTIAIVSLLGMLLFHISSYSQDNIAYGKKATQSSSPSSGLGLANLAVDGNYDGTWKNLSVTRTKTEANPWWMVDLGERREIKEILVWGRTDCCRERLDNLRILISKDNNTWEEIGTHNYTGNESFPLSFWVVKRARYVKLQLRTSSGVLSLAEVRVIVDQGKETRKDIERTGKNVEKATVQASKDVRNAIHNSTVSVTKAAVKEVTKPISYAYAEERGKGSGFLGTDCSKGAFFDVGKGKCYSCPTGYTRTTAAVTSGKACMKRN